MRCPAAVSEAILAQARSLGLRGSDLAPLWTDTDGDDADNDDIDSDASPPAAAAAARTGPRILFSEATYYDPRARQAEFPRTARERLIEQVVFPLLLRPLRVLWERVCDQFSTDDAKRLSVEERRRERLGETSLVYGEVSFDSFARCLWAPEAALPRTGGVFVDLGHGSGRGIVAAALLHDFDELVGIELLHGLFHASLAVQEVGTASRTTLSFAPLMAAGCARSCPGLSCV